MPATNVYSLPFPDDNSPFVPDDDIEALAEAVEDELVRIDNALTDGTTGDLDVNSVTSGTIYAPGAVMRVASNRTPSVGGGVTTTETTVQSVTADLVAGRTYQITWYGRFTASVASDRFINRLREDSVSGTEMTGSTFFIDTTSTAATIAILQAEYTPVSNETKTFVGTIVRASGTATITPRDQMLLYVEYVRG